jgi:Holliday junction DNA helicase RuvA
MIASIRGILRATAANHLVIETSGIGFQVYAPRPVLERAGAVGEEMTLLTVLIVREDALTLYGFADAAQRTMFETLIGVSGVGPRIALALLSSATPDEIRLAVAHSDGARLARVPGIGKKMAERLLLELKGKLDLKNLPAAAGAESAAPAAPAAPGVASVNNDLAELLVSLGYSSSEAQAAIAALPADAPAELEERLRLALRYFGSA